MKINLETTHNEAEITIEYSFIKIGAEPYVEYLIEGVPYYSDRDDFLQLKKEQEHSGLVNYIEKKNRGEK